MWQSVEIVDVWSIVVTHASTNNLNQPLQQIIKISHQSYFLKIVFKGLQSQKQYKQTKLLRPIPYFILQDKEK